MSCIQKHKKRADCSGVRDPTAFIPLSQLRTPAGIDHDYNFISSIERARERSEREIIEARRLLSEKDLRPDDEDKRFIKVWQGSELRHMPVDPKQPLWKQAQNMNAPPSLPSVPGRELDRQVRRRLKELNIEVVMMPKGMVRQRENDTSWNRKSKGVNFTTEWLVFGIPGLCEDGQPQPTRILHKTLEKEPLSRALGAAIHWLQGQLDYKKRELQSEDVDEAEDGRPNKKRNTGYGKKAATAPPQDWKSNTWPASEHFMQNPHTGQWNRTYVSTTEPKDEFEATYAGWQFFLHRAQPPSAPTPAPVKGKVLVPLSATDTLVTALEGRTVIEFPTIYAFPPLSSSSEETAPALPEGFVLGSPSRREKRKYEPARKDEAEEGEISDDSTGESSSLVFKRRKIEQSQKQQFASELRGQHQTGKRGRGGGRGGGRRGRGGKVGLRGGADKSVQFKDTVDVAAGPDAEVSADEGGINEGEATGAASGADVEMGGVSEEGHQAYEQRKALSQSGSSGYVDTGVDAGTPEPKPAKTGLVDYDSAGDSD